NLRRAELRLWVVVPIALALIFALLYLTYHRLSDVLLIFSGVPFACVGGVLALWWRGLPFLRSAGGGCHAPSSVAVSHPLVRWAWCGWCVAWAAGGCRWAAPSRRRL